LGAEKPGDMQFWTPIEAHAQWLSRLREFIYGAGEMSVSEAASDEACELGRWLREEAKPFKDLPEYRAVHDAHVAFHRRASLVVALAASGMRAEAAAELNARGSLRQASTDLIDAFQQFKRRVRAMQDEAPAA
jgi:hypothetical protein